MWGILLNEGSGQRALRFGDRRDFDAELGGAVVFGEVEALEVRDQGQEVDEEEAHHGPVDFDEVFDL